MKQNKEALVSVDSGVVKAKEQGRTYDEQRLLLQKYYALHNLKRYREAVTVMEWLSQQPEMMTLLSSKLEVFKGMSETQAALGNFKPAYEWSVRYSQLSDSINASRLKNEIHDMEIKYGNAEKQKAIEALKMENEKSSLSARNTRLMIWFLASVCILLFILAVVTFLYMRNNKKLSQQKDLFHQQQLREIEQQQQIHVGHALLQGEERERRRVAGDLHDGLGGLLAGVKMNLTGMATETKTKDLTRVVDQLDHSISELRRIARNMMPEALLKFGLETALKEACENLISDKVNIRFQTYGIRSNIPHEKQLTIYRVVQELLNNAIKHASANEILLQCSQNNDTFFITLEDNGKGFDTSAIRSFKGIGLSNVKNRVDYLNGKLEINSTVNEGTSINIELNVAE
jgi:signal transduction histidine kinase